MSTATNPIRSVLIKSLISVRLSGKLPGSTCTYGIPSWGRVIPYKRTTLVTLGKSGTSNMGGLFDFLSRGARLSPREINFHSYIHNY